MFNFRECNGNSRRLPERVNEARATGGALFSLLSLSFRLVVVFLRAGKK